MGNAPIKSSIVWTKWLRFVRDLHSSNVSAVAQDSLRRASPVVQLCVVHGRSLVGMNTQNASACLMAEVRRVRGLLEGLGAFLLVSALGRLCARSIVSLL